MGPQYFEKFTVAFSVSYFIMMFVTISAVPVPFVDGDDPHFGSNRVPLPPHHRIPDNSHHPHRHQRPIPLNQRERPIPQDHRDFQNRRFLQIPRPIQPQESHHAAPLPRPFHNKRRREAEQFGDRSYQTGWRFHPEQEEEEHFYRNRRDSRDQRDFDVPHQKSQKQFQEEKKNSLISIPAMITFKGDGIKIKNNVDLVNIEVDTSDDSDETNLEVVEDQ
jgi:hypothetical protein